MSYNKIKGLPNNIDRLQNLRTLTLDENPIESLPESFFKLVDLRMLDLSGTSLYEIPSQIGDLDRLEYLNLGDLGLNAEQQNKIKSYMERAKAIEIIF